MLLASQVAGALIAGLVVILLARNYGFDRRRAVGVIAMVAVVVASLLSVPNLRSAVASFLDQREANLPLSPEEARLRPGEVAGADVKFLAWVKERLASGETLQLVFGSSDIASRLIAQWALFQLAPHVGVSSPTEADWIVFYGAAPKSYSNRHFVDLQVYASGYAMARYRLAG